MAPGSPAAVGVDIGCGMVALKTDLKARDLPDDLHAMRTAIESAVPHGPVTGATARSAQRTASSASSSPAPGGVASISAGSARSIRASG